MRYLLGLFIFIIMYPAVVQVSAAWASHTCTSAPDSTKTVFIFLQKYTANLRKNNQCILNTEI